MCCNIVFLIIWILIFLFDTLFSYLKQWFNDWMYWILLAFPEQLWSHTPLPIPASSTTLGQRSFLRMGRLTGRSWGSSSSMTRKRGSCSTPSPTQRSIEQCSKRSCSTFWKVRQALGLVDKEKEDHLLKVSQGCLWIALEPYSEIR